MAVPPLQFSGISSGLDIQAIVDALMSVEQAPLKRLQAQMASLQATRDAYAKLGAALQDLLTKAQAFTVNRAGAARTATSSNAAALTAAASAGALPGVYQVTVDRLATATVATSLAPVGSPITATDASNPMSSLPLSGTVTAGSVGLIVDGVVLHVTVGDPTTTSLQSVLDAIAGAIQGQLQAGGEANAAVTASVVNNRVQIAVSGTTQAHALAFGVAGDTSNLLSIIGLAGVSTSTFDGTNPVSGTAALGVVRTTTPLDAAGLAAGLTSTTSGQLVINGVTIGYDTTVDSLLTVLARINTSGAGVVASIDRANDRIVLTNRSTGPAAIDVRDVSGNLAAALQLAPGTTNAQTLGQSAQLTVDGRTVTSPSNQVTTAIPGVTLTLTATTTSPVTVAVDVDRQGIRSALQALVDSYNALADLLDKTTAHTPGQTAPLEGEEGIDLLALQLRSLLMTPMAGATGPIRSLADVGVTGGPVGSAPTATRRLTLDGATLDAALNTNPDQVATLLDDAAGILAPLVDRLTALTGFNGMIQARTAGIDATISGLQRQSQDEQERLDAVRASLEARYAAMESLLAQLSAVQNALGSQTAGMNRTA
jgi:flagellar hook-associated protein 2